MTLRTASPPYLRGETTYFSMTRDMMIALTVLLIVPAVRFGPRPVVTTALTALACAASEVVFHLIQTRATGLSDASSLVTGMILALLMPADAPYWLPAAAGVFAVVAAKGPFGSTGHNPFNPAAAGFAFAAVFWPQRVFAYPDPNAAGWLPVFSSAAAKAAASPAAVLKNGLKPDLPPLDMLWGVFAGPVGATGVLTICACGLYLFLKRTAKPEATAFFLAAAALAAALFPRVSVGALTSVKYELMSGSLLFCAVFVVTDPVTAPRTALGRCAYGVLAGALTMAFRRWGAFEQGACFAVLIANACAPLIDAAVCEARGWGGKLYEP